MKKILSVVFAIVLTLTFAMGTFAEATAPAPATGEVYVMYNFPGLTGVTLNLKVKGEDAVVASATTSAEEGEAIIAVDGLTETVTYVVEAVCDGVAFNAVADNEVTVEVALNDAGTKYTAKADAYVVLYTGYTRTIVDEEFENLTQVADPKVEWKQAVKSDDGIFVGNSGVSIVPADLTDITAAKTSGSKWGDQDGIRTPSFAMKAERLYTAAVKLMAIENDVFASTWTDNGNCLRITKPYDNKVNYLLAFKDWDKNEWNDDYDYQWNPSGYGYDWDISNAMPDGYYWKDKQGNISNLASNGQWGHNDNTADEWTTVRVSIIPKQDINDVVFEASPFSKHLENANYEYEGTVYDKVWFAPHIYVDSIVITETIPNPAQPDEIPEIPEPDTDEEPELPEIPEAVKQTGWFCTGEQYHAMIIGRAIISLPHELNADGTCIWCRYHADITEEEVEIESAYESETEEAEEDVVEDENPFTGLAFAALPAILAVAVIITKKR